MLDARWAKGNIVDTLVSMEKQHYCTTLVKMKSQGTRTVPQLMKHAEGNL